MTDPRTLLSLLLPSEEGEDTRMYYRTKGPKGLPSKKKLPIAKGASLFLDGYYNVWDFAPYLEQGTIGGARYHLSVEGEGTVGLWLTQSSESAEGWEDILLSETPFSEESKGEIEIPVPLSSLHGKGFLSLSLTALSDAAFYGGALLAEADPPQSVRIGVAITTYRREEYVKRNVALLLRDLPADRFLIYVTDNGGTLSPKEVAGARLIRNRNLGGSGGFTRGIMEILREGKCTHVLLTDDDIAFRSEIFLRTAALLSYAGDPDQTTVGASMLYLDEPTRQKELGASWSGRRLLPHGEDLDLTDKGALLQNAEHRPASYTAWWYHCFPVTLPKRIGLPFPFFIKMDDVEYCLRANCPILLLNGIGVRHERFTHKFTPALEYYQNRNSLILNALYHPERGAIYHFVNLLRAIAKQLLLYRYRTLDLVFRAYDDFLKGAEHFRAQDAERLHRELSEQGERQLPRADIESLGYDLSRPLSKERKRGDPPTLKQILTLNGYLLPAKKEEVRIVDLTREDPASFYRARRVLQYNPVAERGFLSVRRPSALFRAGGKLILFFFKLLFRFGKAGRSFRRAFPSLISEQAWRKRLGLSPPEEKKSHSELLS